MAESAVTNDAGGGHAGMLHKYTGNCSQSGDYNSVVPPLPDFSENISSVLDKQQPLSDCMDTGVVGGLGELAYDFDTSGDTLPNNNVVSGDEGLMDCLLDGGCVSNTSLAGKVSSVSSCGLETNSQQQSQCAASYEHLSATTATDTAYRQLVVKLETPIFDHQQTPAEQQHHHYGTPNVKTSDNSSDSQGKSVSFNNVVDVNNGVIKKKRKTKDDSVSLGKPATVKRQQQRVGGATRGRPPKRPLIATYHSQISGDKNTIKIRIKKAHFSSQVTSPVKKSRQRKKQKKAGASDTDGSDYDDSSKRAKNDASSQINTEMEDRPESPMEQSGWAMYVPPEILHKIFEYVTNEQGALPSLVNLCKVCNLWRQVAVSSVLWENIDLSSTVKDRAKTDFTLHWLIQNRLTACQDLNLSDWKIKNIPTILEELCEYCPEIRGLNLSGWSGLTGENLKYLTSYCSKLERLDLSSVNGSNLGTKSALNASPLVSLAQTMGSRLTHLVLAHNKLAGFSQILTALSAHCPNLQLLDLSNIKTHAYNSSLLHVEKLQQGCPKLRVLRVTNSQILLAPTTLTAQMASPGFPELEELSLAGIEDDQTTSKFIDDNGIERILKSSHKLRLLDVRGCTKITDSGLVKVPAWDLEHLFLSACYVTRLNHSGLELIVQKWSHSLVEIDLAWSTATEPLDAAVMTLAEKGSESPLRVLNLCGSSVSLESVKAVLAKCPHIQSLNLQSCRALPRGIKRLYEGPAVAELRSSLENKPKTEDLDSTGSEEQAESSAEERAAATTITENVAE